MSELRIATESRDDVLIATLAGDIDIVNHAEVSASLLTAALDGGPLLVTDLNSVNYVDSNGVRMLFALARELAHSRIGWAVALLDDSPLQRLFKVTAFDEVTPILPSIEEAVDVLRDRR